MLGLREPAFRCSEDTGPNITHLHSGLSFAPQQRNESVLSVAGLKAGLISIFQLFWHQARVNALVWKACIEVYGGQRSKYFTPALRSELGPYTTESKCGPGMTQNTTGVGGSPILLAHESHSGAGSTCHLQHS